MKQRFIAKRRKERKRHWKVKVLFFFCLFFLSLCYTVQTLVKTPFQENYETLVSVLLAHGNSFLTPKKSSSFLEKTVSYLLQVDIQKPTTLLYNTGYQGFFSTKNIPKENQIEKEVQVSGNLVSKAPQVYIYNTHQKEGYRASSFLEYSVSPNVMLASYILKEALDKANIPSIVEEKNVQEEVSRLGKKYYYSYQVSRQFLEEAREKYQTLTYFIDVHRDSVSREITTLEKDGTTYAKILFIIGLENPNYEANYQLTEQVFEKMDQLVPGITRSIYKKEGEGVDGVYNQDVSPNVMLAEIGGYQNTIEEVYRTTLVLAEAFKEVISK